MALFSPMACFCNACGCQMHKSCSQILGREWRVCSVECLREMNWRQTLSTMGEEYRPQK